MNGQLPQGILAEVTGIHEGNLSRYVRELKENRLVSIEQATSEAGRPTNIVKLTDKARMILTIVLEAQHIQEHTPIEDELIKTLLDMLIDSDLSELAADEIQILSREHLNTIGSKFFTFLNIHLDGENVRKRIRVLLNSTQYFMLGITEEERPRVCETLKESLTRVLEEPDFSSSIKTEAVKILE